MSALDKFVAVCSNFVTENNLKIIDAKTCQVICEFSVEPENSFKLLHDLDEKFLFCGGSKGSLIKYEVNVEDKILVSVYTVDLKIGTIETLDMVIFVFFIIFMFL